MFPVNQLNILNARLQYLIIICLIILLKTTFDVKPSNLSY